VRELFGVGDGVGLFDIRRASAGPLQGCAAPASSLRLVPIPPDPTLSIELRCHARRNLGCRSMRVDELAKVNDYSQPR
jgi:hypothetical protein